MSIPQALDELLRQLSPRARQEAGPGSGTGSGTGPGPQALIDWLGRQLGAEVALVDRAGTVEVSTARFPADVVGGLQPVPARLADGQLAATASQVGAFHVRCEALGRQVPRPVLVVAGSRPLTREALALTSHTGAVIEVVRRARRADDLAVRHQRAAARLRLAILAALMTGEPTLARRMTAGAVPPLLDAERLCVHLLRCPPSHRGRIIEAHEDESGYHGRGLMVRCPVYDDHLICLLPQDDDADTGRADDDADTGRADDDADTGRADDDADTGRADGGLAAPLRALVRDNPDYALGISAPVPLPATAQAYDQARHALAVARHSAERVADYHGRPPLAGLLPRQEALAWARALLEPVRPAPRLTLDITSLALHFPRSGVARLLDVSRNTVTAHLRRVQDALGLDLRDPRGRAELALALAVSDLSPPDDGGAGAERPPTPSLDGLLATEAAVTWARAFLQPLRSGTDRAVHRTLRAWIEAGTDAQRTARDLGISRTTVRAHLRTAEHLLERSLLTPGPGIHDLVHAFRIADRAP